MKKDIWDTVAKAGKKAGVPGYSTPKHYKKCSSYENLVTHLKKFKPTKRIENHKILQQKLIEYINNNKSKKYKAEHYGQNDIIVNRKIGIEIKYANHPQKLRDLQHEISGYKKRNYKVIVLIYNAGINPDKIKETEKEVQKYHKDVKFVTTEN